MPTGVLSKLGDKVSRQNAEMLSVLLAKHGGVKIGHGDNLEQLTMFCRQGYMPITYGIPPYGFFEHPAEHGSIPPHRTDCGAFLLAENIGARSLIFLKDEKGLFDKDPIIYKDLYMGRDVLRFLPPAGFWASAGFQIDQLGSRVAANLIQFFFADMPGVNFDVRPADTDDSKPRFFFALFNLASFTNKYFSCHFYPLHAIVN